MKPNQSLRQLWVDKGAGKAPPIGTHLVDIGDGYRWLGESSTFAHPREDEPREIIPYFLVQPVDESMSGWYLGVEFSGRIALSLQRHGEVLEPGALSVENPAMRDWLTTDPPPGWKPAEFKGITIDIGRPAARAWVSKELDRIVRDYHLDLVKQDGYVIAQGCDRSDHQHATCDPQKVHRYLDGEFIWLDGPNSTDVSYHATRAYYEMYAQLRRQHVGLRLEICSDGGRMIDFGGAAHADYFSTVDSYDPTSNRQAFYDASHVLPSAMLENYVEAWPAKTIENFRYMLRSGMMGWFTLMLDTTSWSREQHDAALEELRLYKATLRPLIREADLYHVGPRADGNGWDGIEYFDERHGRGVVYAFHGTDENVKTYTFILEGLQAQHRYRLHFHDHSSADSVLGGGELMRSGVTVNLPQADSSELIFIERMQR